MVLLLDLFGSNGLRRSSCAALSSALLLLGLSGQAHAVPFSIVIDRIDVVGPGLAPVVGQLDTFATPTAASLSGGSPTSSFAPEVLGGTTPDTVRSLLADSYVDDAIAESLSVAGGVLSYTGDVAPGGQAAAEVGYDAVGIFNSLLLPGAWGGQDVTLGAGGSFPAVPHLAIHVTSASHPFSIAQLAQQGSVAEPGSGHISVGSGGSSASPQVVYVPLDPYFHEYVDSQLLIIQVQGPPAVPEPSTALLGSLSAIGLAVTARRRGR